MEQKKLDRISELTAIARQRELTAEEQTERAALREEYILSFKRSLVAELENTYIVDEKGNKKKVQKTGDRNAKKR